VSSISNGPNKNKRFHTKYQKSRPNKRVYVGGFFNSLSVIYLRPAGFVMGVFHLIDELPASAIAPSDQSFWF
jgi:hypothetical protein